MSIIKNTILDTIDDLVRNLTYYDRKDDEDLTEELFDRAIETGEITIDEMVEKFRECLKTTYPDKV